jgi:hypothetical protein
MNRIDAAPTPTATPETDRESWAHPIDGASVVDSDFARRLEEDAERLDWIESKLFMRSWNGVIDSGSKYNWTIPSSWRHVVANMDGETFRAAIDAARKK